MMYEFMNALQSKDADTLRRLVRNAARELTGDGDELRAMKALQSTMANLDAVNPGSQRFRSAMNAYALYVAKNQNDMGQQLADRGGMKSSSMQQPRVPSRPISVDSSVPSRAASRARAASVDSIAPTVVLPRARSLSAASVASTVRMPSRAQSVDLKGKGGQTINLEEARAQRQAMDRMLEQIERAIDPTSLEATSQAARGQPSGCASTSCSAASSGAAAWRRGT